MTARRVYPGRIPEAMDCDGCKAPIAVGSTAYIRTDGAVFHSLECEGKHPDAMPPVHVLQKFGAMGL